MRKHLTDGELRAALDQELDAPRQQHLEGCAACQARLGILLEQSQGIARRLEFLGAGDDSAPSTRTARDEFYERLFTQKENSVIKKWFAIPVVRFGLIAALILGMVLAFPATRALADQLLNMFRVQQVTVIPIDFTGVTQLTGNDALGSQLSDLISSSTNMTIKPGDPVVAADADEASKLAGFTVRLPDGMTPSQLNVEGEAAFTFTVDLAKAQALLDESGRSDLVLPDSIDGAEISVDIPASAVAGYGTCPKPETDTTKDQKKQIPGREYPDCVILAEIPSPTVNAPADVDVAQLAKIGLEFTGMTSEEAAAYTDSVDWTSTLVVPIPKNAATYEQVDVDGVTGTLIQRPADDAPQYALIWVKDGIVYTISGLGTNSQQAIDMANSLP